MAAIRCKACGRLYSYRKEGCCPGCGAYNRPPKRERVSADGTVQHMTDAAYERRQHAQGKVCFEEKACYETKECFEDQTRQGKRGGENRTAALSPSGSKGRKGPVKSIVKTVIAIMIVYGLFGLLGRLTSHKAEPEVIVEPVYVDLSWTDASMGEELTLFDGSVLTVRAVGVDDDRISVYLETDLAESDHDVYPVLVCLDREGEEVFLNDFTTREDAGIFLDFSTDDWTDLEPLYLALEEWGDQDNINTWFIALR